MATRRPDPLRLALLALVVLAVLALAACAPDAAPTGQPPDGPAPTAPAAWLILPGPGWYEVSGADLRPLGWDSALEAPDPSQMRLVCGGIPTPFTTEGAGRRFRLRFFTHPLPDRYTAQASCQLSTTASAVCGETPCPQPVETETLRVEANAYYEPVAETDNPWFWERLIAPASQEFPFPLAERYAAAPARLELRVWSKTQDLQISPDHRLTAWLNDTQVAQAEWDGITVSTLTADLPANLLRSGENRLRLEMPGAGGQGVEMVFLDDFTLTFTGLPPPESFLAPVAVRLAQTTPDLRDPALAAAYLAIGPEDLLAAVEPLLAHRAAQGLSARAIPAQAIYDQFGRGLPEPAAIQAFLRFAAKIWPAPPQYVLLVGDYTYDPHNYQPESAAKNQLPAFFIRTTHGGETVTDLPFVQWEDPWLPAAALGRFPANTPEQVRTLVQKTLAFEANPPGRNILAVADNFDPAFAADAQAFIAQLPPDYTARLLAPAIGQTDIPAQITTELEENGDLFFAYFGHGSLRQLGKERLFTVENAAALQNQRATIVLNITCLAGLFTHPEIDSLAEVMLWNPSGGAAAALAATSLTVPLDQAQLTSAFLAALGEAGPTPTLGATLLAAQRATLAATPEVREVIETFLLFGDPALRLPSAP